jgi:16S rRNA (cytosine967-C5)-methyltransferase
VYGTMRLRGRIDYLLAQFVRHGLDSLEPDVLDVLRIGAYQLLEMNSVPAYAAISQSVEMTKSIAGRGATGLVNGVLQSLRRAEDELQPPAGRAAAHYLSTWGSHPRWLVERWLAAFGRTDTEALIDHNNRRPDVFITPVHVTRAEAIARLRGAGLDADEVAAVSDSVRISSAQVVEALAATPAVVQDPARRQRWSFATLSFHRQRLPTCARRLVAKHSRFRLVRLRIARRTYSPPTFPPRDCRRCAKTACALGRAM